MQNPPWWRQYTAIWTVFQIRPRNRRASQTAGHSSQKGIESRPVAVDLSRLTALTFRNKPKLPAPGDVSLAQAAEGPGNRRTPCSSPHLPTWGASPRVRRGQRAARTAGPSSATPCCPGRERAPGASPSSRVSVATWSGVMLSQLTFRVPHTLRINRCTRLGQYIRNLPPPQAAQSANPAPCD